MGSISSNYCDECGEGYEENSTHCIACGSARSDLKALDDIYKFDKLNRELDALDEIEQLRSIDLHIAKVKILQSMVKEQYSIDVMMSEETLVKNFDDALFGAKYRELYNLRVEYRDKSNAVSEDIRKIALRELVRMTK